MHVYSHTQAHTVTHTDCGFQIDARGESMDGGGWRGGGVVGGAKSLMAKIYLER